jgi:hypothetical protein
MNIFLAHRRCGLISMCIWSSFACAGPPLAPNYFGLPAPREASMHSITLWATHYFVYAANASPQGIALRDKAGMELSPKISPGDWCLGAIEGTIQIRDGNTQTTFNFSGKSNSLYVDCSAILNRINPTQNPWISTIGRSYFSAARGAYGDGVKDYRLVQFRTVAVDNRTIPYGTVLFIPDARGADVEVSPDVHLKHDGFFSPLIPAARSRARI